MKYFNKYVIYILPDYKLYNNFSNTPTGVLHIYHLIKNYITDNIELIDLRGYNEISVSNIVKYTAQEYDVHLISAVSCQGNIVKEISKIIKSVNKNNKIVLGGQIVISLISSKIWTKMDICKEFNYIDKFVDGFIWTLNEIYYLIDSIHNDKLFFIKEEYGLHRFKPSSNNKFLSYSYDFEKLRLPVSYENGWINDSTKNSLRVQNMLFSVGCPFKCKFCGNIFNTSYKENINNIIIEIKRRIKKYNIQGLKIDDDDLILDCNYTNKLLDEIDNENINLIYLGHTRCNFTKLKKKKDILIKFNKLGLKVLGIGVECPNDDILKLINKQVTLQDIKDSIQMINDYTDVKILSYMIYGLPNLNKKVIDDYIEFIQWAKGKIEYLHLSSFVPLIGTEFYENPDKYNIINYVPYPNDKIKDWDKFYFNGSFNEVRSKPKNINFDDFISYKIKICEALKENGFLRKELENDIKEAGYTLKGD